MDSIFADETEGARFDDGFPNSLSQYGNKAIHVVEDALLLRAFDHGIQSVGLYEADLTPQQAFRSFGIMPILVDYATHVLGRTLNWSFESGLQEKALLEMLEDSSRQVEISDMIDLVRNKLSRPALYNRADEQALLNTRTAFRERSGIPISVSMLMMDMALETAHQLSQQYHLNLTGDPQPDTLDLSPTCDLLANLDWANPRVDIPGDLMARTKATQQKPSHTATLSDQLGAQPSDNLNDRHRGT